MSINLRNDFEKTGNLLRILGSVCVTTIWAISMYTLYVYLGAVLLMENKFSLSQIALAFMGSVLY